MVASPGHGSLGPNLVCLVACSASGARPNLASRTLRAWLGSNSRFGRSSGARPEPAPRGRSVTVSAPTGDCSSPNSACSRGSELRHLPSPSPATSRATKTRRKPAPTSPSRDRRPCADGGMRIVVPLQGVVEGCRAPTAGCASWCRRRDVAAGVVQGGAAAPPPRRRGLLRPPSPPATRGVASASARLHLPLPRFSGSSVAREAPPSAAMTVSATTISV